MMVDGMVDCDETDDGRLWDRDDKNDERQKIIKNNYEEVLWSYQKYLSSILHMLSLL